MKTFKTYIDEAKKWPGGEASAKIWQKISKARHDRIIAQHDPIGPDLPGYASKPGRIHVNKFDDGSHGTQRWSPNKKHVPSVYKITHKDGEVSHWMKRDGLYEMTDAEADAYNEKFEKNVVDAHLKHIHKKYGKDVDCNFGSGSTDNEFTSKVYHPKKGTIRVTTHFHPKTLKVEKHTEE